MLNLYVPFLVYGLFIFCFTVLVWSITNGALSVYPYFCLIGALILFGVASALALYQVKPAAWLGVICLAITTPMFFGLAIDVGLQSGALSAILVVAAAVLYLGMFNSVKVLRTGAPAFTVTPPLRIALTLIPAALLIVAALLLFGLV